MSLMHLSYKYRNGGKLVVISKENVFTAHKSSY